MTKRSTGSIAGGVPVTTLWRLCASLTALNTSPKKHALAHTDAASYPLLSVPAEIGTLVLGVCGTPACARFALDRARSSIAGCLWSCQFPGAFK